MKTEQSDPQSRYRYIGTDRGSGQIHRILPDPETSGTIITTSILDNPGVTGFTWRGTPQDFMKLFQRVK